MTINYPKIMLAGIFTLLYAMQEFKPANENIDSLVPNLVVESSHKDYQNGIDVFLEAALNFSTE